MLHSPPLPAPQHVPGCQQPWQQPNPIYPPWFQPPPAYGTAPSPAAYGGATPLPAYGVAPPSPAYGAAPPPAAYGAAPPPVLPHSHTSEPLPPGYVGEPPWFGPPGPNHPLAQVLATQPDWPEASTDATRDRLEFSERVLDAVRRHDALMHWDAPPPPAPVCPPPMGYGFAGFSPPPAPPLPPHVVVSAPPGITSPVGREALKACAPSLEHGTSSCDTTAGTPVLQSNTPPLTPLKVPAMGSLDLLPAAHVLTGAADATKRQPSSTPEKKPTLEMSPALREIRSMMAATREEDEEEKAKTQRGAELGAKLLALVQDGPDLKAEGIIEAMVHTDGYRYVQVDGEWIGGETARYYCRYCRYWCNNMEAHIASDHHAKNRDNAVKRRQQRQLEAVPRPNNSRWAQQQQERRTSSSQGSDWPRRPSKGSSPDELHPAEAKNADGVDRKLDTVKAAAASAATGPPPKPSPPWRLAWSQEHSAYYFWNTETKKVQWDAPDE